MSPFLCVLCKKVKALTFVFKLQVHLGSLTYKNGACELFTVSGLTLVPQTEIFFAVLLLKPRDGCPSQAAVAWDCCVIHYTHNSQMFDTV